ncbi:MAG: hypothetical protein ABSG36_04735 [Acidimicrobiales bacterium]
MHIVAVSSPDEMISVFLRADLDSSEDKTTTLRKALSRRDVSAEVLDPVRDDQAGSSGSPALRQSILMDCHGLTVAGLSLETIAWSWAQLEDDDPLFLMNYWQFVEWTHGTLRPRDAIEGFTSNRHLASIIARITSGTTVPPCICVATDEGSPAVLLDGSGRATALANLGRYPTPIVLGISPGVRSWNFYPASVIAAERRDERTSRGGLE